MPNFTKMCTIVACGNLQLVRFWSGNNQKSSPGICEFLELVLTSGPSRTRTVAAHNDNLPNNLGAKVYYCHVPTAGVIPQWSWSTTSLCRSQSFVLKIEITAAKYTLSKQYVYNTHTFGKTHTYCFL